MKRASAVRTHHSPHFYIIFAAAMFSIGIFAALVATKVVGSTTGDTTIYACVNSNSGTLRIVGSSATCHTGETALTWNIQGPQGPAGAPAPTGAQTQSASLPFSCIDCVLYPVASRFKGQDLSYAQIEQTQFQGSDLSGINFKGANLTFVNFSNTNLTGADFSGAGNYPGSTFSGDDFTNANLTNVNFTNTNLKYAKNMSTATIIGAIWNNTTCPDATNSNNDGNTCAAHL